MDTDFCVTAMEEVIACFGRPEVFNAVKARCSPASPSQAP